MNPTIEKQNQTARDLHLQPGLSTCIVRPDKFDPAVHLPAFAAAGFKCIELNCFIGSDDFAWDRAPRVKELRYVADSTGVRVFSVHAEGGIGVCRGTRSEQMSVDLFKTYADLAAELGATMVTIHGDLPHASSRVEAENEFRKSLETLVEHVRDMPCAFGWENLPWGNLRDSPPEILSVADHLNWIRRLGRNNFGFVLDTGHSNLSGVTEAYLSACDGLLNGLHVNDNNAQADHHWAPGPGTVDWKGFVSRLLKNNYVGPLMLEIVGTGRPPRPLDVALAEARASIEFLKNVD